MMSAVSGAGTVNHESVDYKPIVPMSISSLSRSLSQVEEEISKGRDVLVYKNNKMTFLITSPDIVLYRKAE